METHLIEAVIRVQNGDKDAVAVLYDEYIKPVYFQVSHITDNEQDIGKLTTSVWSAVFHRISDLEDPADFPELVSTITACVSANYLIDSGSVAESPADSGNVEYFEEKGTELIPEEALRDTETARIVYDIVQKLPLSERSCIFFYYYEGLTVKEIADNLAVSENTVKIRLSSARAKIREELEIRGEKDGLKLWTATPLILIPVLKFALQTTQVPAAITSSVLSGLGIGTATTTVAASAATAGTTAAAGTSAAATTVATTTSATSVTTAASATGITVGSKIIIAGAASVIVAGSVVTGVLLSGEPETMPVEESPAIIEVSQEPAPASEILIDLRYQDITDEVLAELVANGEIPDDAPVSLDLSYNAINDISPLAELTNITHLDLRHNKIDSYYPLAKLTNLTSLELGGNTGDDIAPLAGLKNLTSLSPGGTIISDITPLIGLVNLTELNLRYVQIDSENLRTLKEALPDCRIIS